MYLELCDCINLVDYPELGECQLSMDDTLRYICMSESVTLYFSLDKLPKDLTPIERVEVLNRSYGDGMWEVDEVVTVRDMFASNLYITRLS